MGKLPNLSDVTVEDGQLVVPIQEDDSVTQVECPLESIKRKGKLADLWDGYDAKIVFEERNWDDMELLDYTTVELEDRGETYVAFYDGAELEEYR